MMYGCATTARSDRGGWRRWLLAAALAAVCCAAVRECVAQSPAAADQRLAATSDKGAMREAQGAIPWKKLSPLNRQRIEQVIRSTSLYRRLPTRVAACEPEVFDFLVRRPEVVTGVWNLMGISQLSVQRDSETVFAARDSVGGEGRIELLHTGRDAEGRGLTLAFVDGVYHQAPMPRPIRAKCVLLLRSGATVEGNGLPYVTARLDAFVRFDRVAADLVARGLQPLLAPTADHNFIETMKFVTTFSRTAESNPAGMRRLAAKLEGVNGAVRDEMVAVCDRASHAASLRNAAREAERARLAQRRGQGVGAN